jgi:hypothetical protein
MFQANTLVNYLHSGFSFHEITLYLHMEVDEEFMACLKAEGR